MHLAVALGIVGASGCGEASRSGQAVGATDGASPNNGGDEVLPDCLDCTQCCCSTVSTCGKPAPANCACGFLCCESTGPVTTITCTSAQDCQNAVPQGVCCDTRATPCPVSSAASCDTTTCISGSCNPGEFTLCATSADCPYGEICDPVVLVATNGSSAPSGICSLGSCVPLETSDGSYSCPSGYAFTKDQQNAWTCCMQDGGSPDASSDAPPDDTALDATADSPGGATRDTPADSPGAD
jgi:hypothetical protein